MATSDMQPSVLLADDDDVARNVYGSYFSRVGWHFDLVGDGKKCVELASKRTYDVVLTDLMMPGMHGFEVLETLRRFRPTQAIIVVTGTGNTEDIIEAVRKGADDILLKPIDFQMLRSSIERVLTESKKKEGPGSEVLPFIVQDSFVMEIPARDLAREATRQSLIEKLTSELSLERYPILRLELAFQEALANALDHGCLELDSKWRDEIDPNGEDAFTKRKRERLQDPQYGNRMVRLEYQRTPRDLTVSISDEGPGFPGGLLVGDTQKPEHAMKSYGRGMAIMFGTMDRVRFGKNGSQITLVKELK